MIVENESLESRLLALKTERDMRVALDEQHKIHMLKADTIDAHRRAEQLEQAGVAIVAKWQNRVAEMQRQVDLAQQEANEQLMSDLVAKHMADIKEKNALIIELTKQKVKVESKLANPMDTRDIKILQEELVNLISDYEQVINGRLDKIREMIECLKKVTQSNEDVIHVHEDISRVKNAIDLAKKDIAKKQLVKIQITDEIIEIKEKNDELDEEIKVYDDKFKETQGKIDDLNMEIDELEESLALKDQEIEELETQLEEKKLARQQEEEALKQKAIDAAKAAKERKTYVALKGDPIDELMAVHINDCEHWVPVKRQSDGNYLYGQRKINAKIKNDKLVIKVGGGYMLMDEFLKNNAEAEEKAFLQDDYLAPSAMTLGGASPKRGRATMASPKARTKKL